MLNSKQLELVRFIKENPLISSKEIYENNKEGISYATIKRLLSLLISKNLIITKGKGKNTQYLISPVYDLFFPINIDTYYLKEIDERKIKNNFNFDLINNSLINTSIFDQKELIYLEKLHGIYKNNISHLSTSEYNKELERLAIDLSWKSSQIEGNTYSLLETERLLKEKETASGKHKDEAIMLLNHKETIDFIIENPDYLYPISISKIEDIHSILTKELGVSRNIRNRRVGISGTNYKPLDNEHQIRESLLSICKLINKKTNFFEKSFLTLILISYIQPFMDGNKRTARIVSNAILINFKSCPISFRTVNSIEYKKAMLLFYEQNNITEFKKIFITQFEFAVNTYF